MCRWQGCKTQRPRAVARRSHGGTDLCKGASVSWPRKSNPLVTPARIIRCSACRALRPSAACSRWPAAS